MSNTDQILRIAIFSDIAVAKPRNPVESFVMMRLIQPQDAVEIQLFEPVVAKHDGWVVFNQIDYDSFVRMCIVPKGVKYDKAAYDRLWTAYSRLVVPEDVRQVKCGEIIGAVVVKNTAWSSIVVSHGDPFARCVIYKGGSRPSLTDPEPPPENP